MNICFAMVNLRCSVLSFPFMPLVPWYAPAHTPLAHFRFAALYP
jgi:hypothetical protein